ncbi:MAG: hypothetical protein A2664_02640 [Candidatus Taylorbacteria bacterium RIFCSPHIGHO2_01_FULL_46_22b]|uniref:Uncharacterized protein n=1 Tax=Candidatus Taylorbacteria bacterium RIFCSPHIGHO2_01_FULL_46_22b TaxID=1802301 RepID=A0A1G2M3J6_9BACT|nr:MAG: hypothetical protein A2664_02640 [Candidatus Taylorbacteria bacterium RIFCSPHIGHO2_01_FULL_46_22b]
MRTNQQYLHNLATTMIQQLHVSPEIAAPGSVAYDIYEKFSEEIKAKLLRMNPETRGRIADLGLSDYHDTYQPGQVPMYSVHCGTWLDKHDNGRTLVTEIACTVIVAKMAEILHKEWNSFQPTSAEEELADIRARDPIN